MDENNNSSEFSHVYRLKWWRYLWSAFFILFVWMVWGNALLFFCNYFLIIIDTYGLFAPVSFPSTSIAYYSLLFGIIFSILVIVTFTSFPVLSCLAYLKITPDGIEERKFLPKKINRYRYSDIKRLDKYYFSNVLYIHTGVNIETRPFHERLADRFFYIQPMIRLSMYSGWPKGQLYKDLELFIPEIMDKRPSLFDYWMRLR